MGWRADGSTLATRLSQAYLRAGRVEDAYARAEGALDLAVEHKGRGHQAWALRSLGEITSLRDPPEIEQAECHYQQAFALAEELGMRPLGGHCHLGLGRLYRRTAQQQKAHEHLTKAINVFREIDMQSWLQKAEAEMRQLA
jgi:tetratricopeptide (TPR) repeat protein